VETVQIKDLVFTVAPEVAKVSETEPSSLVSIPAGEANTLKTDSQSNRILAIAKECGWDDVRVVGEGGVINQPIELNGWLVMPIGLYKKSIPPEAFQRVETIINAEGKMKGFLIADDLRSGEKQSANARFEIPAVSPDWGKIATGIGKVAAVVAVITAVISFLPILLGVGAIGAALVYDPLLIVVTAEDEWVCIYEWFH